MSYLYIGVILVFLNAEITWALHAVLVFILELSSDMLILKDANCAYSKNRCHLIASLQQDSRHDKKQNLQQLLWLFFPSQKNTDHIRN